MSGTSAELVASGDNFTLHVGDGVVVLRVWSRKEMTFARGAELAQTKIDHLRRLVDRSEVHALIFDLVDAAAVVGPITEETVRAMIRVFTDRDLRVAVLVGESPMQSMQFTRMLRDVIRRKLVDERGLVTRDRAAAATFVKAEPRA
jgi:hypothetical protein